MYINHFGMIQYPFSLTPNTRYFLKLPAHEEAFQQLLLALAEEGRFSKLIGEVGAGKTMLCRKVLNALSLHKESYVTAYIPHPYLDEQSMMLSLADELGLSNLDGASYRDLLRAISAEIIQQSKNGKQIVLFIDEAQAMPVDTLGALYLLTSIDPLNAHFQVVLFGQPELDLVLDQPMLRSLKQDISFSYTLPALDKESVNAYINHRLAKAGYNGAGLFSEDAINAIYQASGGIPRLVNILCHKSLMVAFGKGEHAIPLDFVEDAIKDTEQTAPDKKQSTRFW